MGCRRGTHLRRLHYLLVSQTALVRLPNGAPYLNDLDSWSALVAASGPARFNGLVDPDDIVDRKNPVPVEYLVDGTWPDLTIEGGSLWSFELPGLDVPRLQVSMDIVCATQRYHLECWAEKSTVNDVLLPLARQYRFNLCTFNGEVSTTACFNVVERAPRSGRPARILYISDFDPAGRSMPVSAARKIQFFADRAEAQGRGKVDIQLNPILLTPEQCVEYALPRTPIKEGEKRAGKFEERFGAGATELDALVALHPGALERIVLAEVQRFYDPDVDDAYQEAVRAYRAQARAATARARAAYRAELDVLETDHAALVESVRLEAEALQERARPLFAAVEERLEAEAESLDIEMPEACPGDEWDDPLFDSSRPYVEQVDCFRAFQGKPAAKTRRPSPPDGVRHDRQA